MGKFTKKLHAIVDPIGSAAWRYAGKRSSHIKKIYDRTHSWGYLRKKFLKSFGFSSSNSAAQIASDVYGSTGSIVGRY